MSFLSKFGKVALEVGKASAGFVPVVGPVLGAVVSALPTDKGGERINVTGSDFGSIVQLAMMAEVMGQVVKAPGAEKLKMAAPFVGPVLLATPFMRGKKVHEPALFSQGCMKIMDGTADVLNSLDEDGVD